MPSVSAEGFAVDVASGAACLETSSSGAASVSLSACEEAVTETVEWVGHFFSP